MKVSKEIKKKRLYYLNINKIVIPKKLPGGEIQPHFWYVIYEDNLLRPKILNKSFKSKVFAKQYINSNLSEYKTNILYGKDLVKYGFNEFHKSYRYLTGKYSKDLETSGDSYAFLKELSFQRRKTLRTMYRRNLRRILKKLIENGYTETIFFDR